MKQADSAEILSAREAEALSRPKLEAFQAARLRSTIQVVTQSRYWRERFDAAHFDPDRLQRPEDLFGAPTMAKTDYAAALAHSPGDYGGLLTADLEEIRRQGAMLYRTTGTSGKQGQFINSNAGFQVFADQGRQLIRAAGGRPGDPVMITWPLFSWAASWGFYIACQTEPFLAVPSGPPADTQMRLDYIRQYRPSVIVCTPSYAVTLGQAARDAGLVPADHGVKGLLIGGELFGASKRRVIEELWGLPGGTRNFYGISEGGPLFAVECEAQDGLHLFEGDTIHQFWELNADQPGAPGKLCEHVFTSISQRTMATWFNFRTRDGAYYTDEPCRCGRTTRRMWIAERLDDMVKIKGVNVFSSGVEELLAPIQGVGREFLLVINQVASKEVLTLQVEVADGHDAAGIRDMVSQAMVRAWGINFAVECLAPGTLPRTEGKVRRWRDLRPKES